MRISATSLLLPLLFGATFAFAQGPQGTIQHVIVVIQENRNPTTLFHEDGTLMSNGAHVQPPNNQGMCHGTPITLTSQPLNVCWDPDHSHLEPYPSWEQTYDNGAMDGACDTYIHSTNCDGLPVPGNAQYTYVSNATGILSPYFQIAEQYGFANWMFQTNQGPSYPAHQFLFSGTSAPEQYNTNDNYYQWFVAENPVGRGAGGNIGCVAEDTVVAPQLPPPPPIIPEEAPGYNGGYPCYNHPTLASLLDSANPNITWKYYADNPYQIWTAPNSIQGICYPLSQDGKYCDGTDWNNNVLPDTGASGPGQVLNDIYNCNLAAVSWVTPDGTWSDHAGSGSTAVADAGPSWVAAIVNAVGGSDPYPKHCGYWQNTVVLITWDDWGGFYDDIAPPDCQTSPCTGYSDGTGAQYVYGFRVPLLVVSAYTKQVTNTGGYISGPCSSNPCSAQPGTVHDFGSILNFIEYVFGSNGQPLGYPSGIGGSQYPYADYFALDGHNSYPANAYSLQDFFNFGDTPRAFSLITGAKYPPSCFINPASCFADYPQDPDDDVAEGAED